jgi:hypothetical protein
MKFKLDFETVLVSITGTVALILRDPPTALAFGLSCGVFVFIRFLDRKRLDDVTMLYDEIQKLKNRLEHIQLGKVIGR